MDSISILKSILGGNATKSSRVEEIQKRQSSSSQAAPSMGDILGSILGGGKPAPKSPGSQGHQGTPVNPTSTGSTDEIGSKLEEMLGVDGAGSSARSPAPSRGTTRATSTSESDPIPGINSRRRPRRREPESDQATTLIRAMCNAAKVDGDIDRTEQQAILDRIGKVGKEELEFVRNELNAPLNIDDYCDSVPDNLAEQAYAFSVLGIKLDSLAEAAYLGRLAANLELETKTCNEIHKKMGAPALYSGAS